MTPVHKDRSVGCAPEIASVTKIAMVDLGTRIVNKLNGDPKSFRTWAADYISHDSFGCQTVPISTAGNGDEAYTAIHKEA